MSLAQPFVSHCYGFDGAVLDEFVAGACVVPDGVVDGVTGVVVVDGVVVVEGVVVIVDDGVITLEGVVVDG